ncbi:hypothetical protein DERP_013078 [Dermatophagoides pteronyssinus]|uniref:Uncharacterized protein n=1 Tax=Dermatophagoides pteronyssinus TaxID=6956 RepID=A0ABQ8JPW4_DERPT|nr:hypothetical protein DERP_013078 [Dermatophagoides pteronyssinus]
MALLKMGEEGRHCEKNGGIQQFDDACSLVSTGTTARGTNAITSRICACLRNWLHLQDICSFCHKTLYGE